MKREEYLYRLADYFVHCSSDDFGEEVLGQVKRCLIDHLGCAVFSTAHDCCQRFTELIRTLGPGEGQASVWGSEEKLSPILAAFTNAVRTSSIELDDCSGIGASVHPGVYVMSSALAMWEATHGSEEDFIRAVVFGYDVCMRMGLLATERVRELGLHGPGLVGGFSAAATASILNGLTAEQTCNALCITAALLPVCPFTSFMKGTDAKDLYGGWGVYLGMFAAEAARRGLTGPQHIIEGTKSLECIFAGDRGLDVEPGTHVYINDISFKQFSACHSVHPAMTAVQRLLERTSLRVAEIRHVVVSTYPYSYALNQGVVEPLNPSSARLSLTFTVAVALLEGELSPKAFLPDGLANPEYQTLRQKITVEKNDGYGDGPFSIRGTRITVEMNDGTVYEEEVQATKWEKAPSDQELTAKFLVLTSEYLDDAQRQVIQQFALGAGKRDIHAFAQAMRAIRVTG